MQKILLVLLLFILLGCSQSQVPTILVEEYSFLMFDGTMTKVGQANDTLYKYDCFIDHPCYFKSETHYKITESRKSGDFTILKLEWLDTIPLSFELCPGKRFSIMALKNVDRNQFGYITPFSCLTREQLDTFQINNLSLNDESVLTYFSDRYLKELSTYKRISTKDAVKEVLNAIKNNDFDSGEISYSSEELNKACIEKGYNPKGAGLAIDSLMK